MSLSENEDVKTKLKAHKALTRTGALLSTLTRAQPRVLIQLKQSLQVIGKMNCLLR